MEKTELGRKGELLACELAEKKGLKILCRNFRVKGGEIDIIAANEQYVCFIEVKYRTRPDALVFESINRKKRQCVIRAAERYILKTGCELQPRFDVAIIGPNTAEYIENAYGKTDF